MANILDANYQGSNDDSDGLGSSTNGWKWGVEFVPSITASISKVSFTLQRVETPTWNLYCEIWSDNGSDVPNAQIGSDSATVAAGGVSTSPVWVDFTFPTPVPVTAGVKYHVNVGGDFSSADETNFIRVYEDNTSPTYGYIGVENMQNTGTWQQKIAGTSRCKNFREYYDDTTIPLTGGYINFL